MERCCSCSQTKRCCSYNDLGRFNMAIMVMMIYHHHHPLHHNHRHHHHHPTTKGCCSSPHTKRCCLASGIIGSLVLLVGLVLMVAGRFFPHYCHDNCSHWIHHSLHYCLHCFHFSRGLLEGAILKSMALKEGSGRWNDNWQPPDCMLIVKTMMMIIIVIIIIIIIFIVIRTDTWLTPEKMNIKAHLTG